MALEISSLDGSGCSIFLGPTSGPKARCILPLTVSITAGFFKISFSIIPFQVEHTSVQLRRFVRLSWAIFVIIMTNGTLGKHSQSTGIFSSVIVLE